MLKKEMKMWHKLIAIDTKVSFWFSRQYHHTYLNNIMKFFSKVGDFGFVWLVVIAISAMLPNTQGLSLRLIYALLLATLLGQGIIKSSVKRLRPCQRYQDVKLLIVRPKDTSFPSGHTASSFACACVICFFHISFGMIAMIFAILIGLSRMYLFVHYFSDILMAIYLGIGVGILIMIF